MLTPFQQEWNEIIPFQQEWNEDISFLTEWNDYFIPTGMDWPFHSCRNGMPFYS
jgi:hypothetical protein